MALEKCQGEARLTLETICQELPTERCIKGPDENRNRCQDGEFMCGDDDQCVDYLKVCDGKFDCCNGADEKAWYVKTLLHVPFLISIISYAMITRTGIGHNCDFLL